MVNNKKLLSISSYSDTDKTPEKSVEGGRGKGNKRKLSDIMESTAAASSSKKLRGLPDVTLHISFSNFHGRLLACGGNHSQQLGLGERYMMAGDDVTSFRVVPGFLSEDGEKLNLADIACGGMHSLAISDCGTKLWSWGCNDNGQLGRPETEEKDICIPKEIKFDFEETETFVSISAGDNHSAVLTSNGRVFVWGIFMTTERGCLGLLPGLQQSNAPVQLLPNKNLPKVSCVALASGENQLIILSNRGDVFTLGCGSQGALGRFAFNRCCVTNRRAGTTDFLFPGKVEVKRTSKRKRVCFDSIWVGNNSCFAKTASDDVFGWGLNNSSQLAIPRSQGNEAESETQYNVYFPTQIAAFQDLNIVKIVSSSQHTLALTNEGNVYSWGERHYGKLGHGPLPAEDSGPLLTPTAIRAEKFDELFCVDIAVGGDNSYAVTKDGDVYAWGAKSSMIGLFDSADDLEDATDDVYVPTQISHRILETKKALAVRAGGQHCLILVDPNSSKS